MHEIDKKKFGAFVSLRRREKGMTQKELAGKLYISDKAVSKWETGASIPDVSLLIPLAECLDVTVTELLLCHMVEEEKTMAVGQVEDIVKTAMTYGTEELSRAYKTKDPRGRFRFFLAAFLGLVEVILCALWGTYILIVAAVVPYALAAVFGTYFWFWIPEKLPRYYDENKIAVYSDGVFRMNMCGVSFNNRNWPHILRSVRTWAGVTMFAVPTAALLTCLLPPPLHVPVAIGIFLMLMISLFTGLYRAGRNMSDTGT